MPLIYDGEVIHSARDEFGPVEIVDEATSRTMHFGSRARQTTMFLNDSKALSLSYTRCMLSGLLFAPAPRSVLILGLGGGALVRFIRYYLPQCRIAVVEKRALVVALARKYFALPEDENFALHVEPAEVFLGAGHVDRYDWILVDLHNHDGMAPALAQPDFFTRCRSLLGGQGVLAVNLWTGDRESLLKSIHRALRWSFDDAVLHLPVSRKRNTVAFGFDSPRPSLEVRSARRTAMDLEAAYGGVEFSQFLRDLLASNPVLVH